MFFAPRRQSLGTAFSLVLPSKFCDDPRSPPLTEVSARVVRGWDAMSGWGEEGWCVHQHTCDTLMTAVATRQGGQLQTCPALTAHV